MTIDSEIEREERRLFLEEQEIRARLKGDKTFTIKIKLLNPLAKVPNIGRPGDAGFDLFPLKEGVIFAGKRELINLGFATEFSEDLVAQVDDRGSMGMKHLTHLAGVIDSNYRGEWGVILANLSGEHFRYSPDKAIAQVLFLPRPRVLFEEVSQLEESVRGEAWNGSSDKGN